MLDLAEYKYEKLKRSQCLESNPITGIAPTLPPSLMQHTYGRGEYIPLPPNVLWQIEFGIVRTLTWNDEGKQSTLGLWSKGDIIGEPLSNINPYEAECMTSVTVSVLPSSLWYQAFDAMFAHVQQAEELLHILHCDPIHLRLRLLLCWLAEKFGSDTLHGRLISLNLTHQEIAELINTTRVTVTRNLKQLEQNGIISYYKGRSIVLLSSTS
jgi:CRP-like cAMP-binding protein